MFVAQQLLNVKLVFKCFEHQVQVGKSLFLLVCLCQFTENSAKHIAPPAGSAFSKVKNGNCI